MCVNNFIDPDLLTCYIRCRECRKPVAWIRETIDGYCSEPCRDVKKKIEEKVLER
jgi:hypothetical protein